jgi:hypothetical protein
MGTLRRGFALSKTAALWLRIFKDMPHPLEIKRIWVSTKSQLK